IRGESQLRFGRRQGRFGLTKLLVDLRRVDFTQNIASFDLGADIIIPLFQVAAGLGVDWCLIVRISVAGELSLYRRRWFVRKHTLHVSLNSSVSVFLDSFGIG